MCGFYGKFSNTIDVSNIERYLKKIDLSHRGPDDHCKFLKPNIEIEFFRLKILGGNKGSQPMMSFDKKWLVAFNGEIYNYIELAKKINKPELISSGDTRVLVEYIATKGVEGIKDMNGMFAMIIYNIISKKIYLVRDRFGIKPLYCKVENEILYFASEIKALPNSQPNQTSIDSYLKTGKYPENKETFFKDIFQILPGTINSFYKNKITSKKFYSLIENIKKYRNNKRSFEEYESLIEQSIRLRFRSDVPINIHFSGGVDSTALLIKIKETLGWDYPIEASCLAFDKNNQLDYNYAKKICKFLNVKLNKVTLKSSEVPDLAHKLQYYEDEPFGGIPSVAMYKLNKIERKKGFIVSLEGQGGDEGLGGYLSHVYLTIKDLFEKNPNSNLIKRLLNHINTDLKTALSVAENYISSGFNAHQDLTNMRSNFYDKKIKKNFGWLETAQINNILTDKIPRTLRFHDRISSACSRELRFPFLDHNVLAYGISFDIKEKYELGLPKSPLIKIINRYLPKELFSNIKRSDSSPQTQWLKNDLKIWAKKNISEVKKKIVITKDLENEIKSLFKKKNLDNSFPIWQLINLNLMLNYKNK